MNNPMPETISWLPQNEQKCVWMTAGVLTYKLCNHDMDCENCMLHNALLESEQKTKRDNFKRIKQ
jgi:hypothetical protein